MAARRKKNINEMTSQALSASAPADSDPEVDEASEPRSVLDELEAEAESDDDPEPVREDPAKVFSMAAQRFISRLYLVTDPRIKKPGGAINNETGEPLYMTQKEMFDAYKAVIAQFRQSVIALPEPAQTLCMKHLREIESMARQVRFNPQDRPRSETVLMRQKHDLRKNVLARAESCRRELSAKLPQQASA